MKFINNFLAVTTAALEANATALPVSSTDSDRFAQLLQAGEICRLTLTGSLDATKAPAFEIIEVKQTVYGYLEITRGLENTAVGSWPAGSFVYAGLTAGMLEQLVPQVETPTRALFGMSPGDYSVDSDIMFVYQTVGVNTYENTTFGIAESPCCFDLLLDIGPNEGQSIFVEYRAGGAAYTVELFGVSADVTTEVINGADSPDYTGGIRFHSGANKRLLLRVDACNQVLIATCLHEWPRA